MVIWEKNVNIFVTKLNVANVTAYFYKHTIKVQVCQISKHLNQIKWFYALFNIVTQQNKYEKIAHLYPRGYILSVSL